MMTEDKAVLDQITKFPDEGESKMSFYWIQIEN